jgi:undecaprenyl-diphosphatase
VLLIGLAQALALVPGASRSGITMTAARAPGLTRSAAARFSFLLSIPVIALAGVCESATLVAAAAPVDVRALAIGVLVSGVSAWTCIHFFMKLVERTGMLPYVVYRTCPGAWLFWLFP